MKKHVRYLGVHLDDRLDYAEHAKIATEIWAPAMERKDLRRRMTSVQRLRVISGKSTISEAADLVIASVMPIVMIVKVKQQIYL